MKKLLVGLAVMSMLVAVVPILAQTDNASACIVNGYSPGYFKNNLDAWGTISPYAYFDEALKPAAAGYELVGPHLTLIEVLKTGGGQWDAFNRQAVAALINSDLYYPDWYSKWFVTTTVNNAYLTGDWATPKALFEAVNTLN